MKILMLTTSFPASIEDERGIFIKRLCDALYARGIDLTVIGPHKYDGVVPYTVQSISGFFFGARSLLNGSGLLPELKRRPYQAWQLPVLLLRFITGALREAKHCDIIHAHWSLTGLAALIVARITGKPFMITMRGADVSILNSFLGRLVTTPILQQARVLAFVGSSLMKELLGRYPEFTNKAVVIENGVSFSVSGASLTKLPAHFIALVGSVIPRKGLEQIIKALALYHADGIPLSVAIAGRCDDVAYAESLRREARALGVEERVEFLGAIPPDQIGTFLKHAALFVSASRSEGRPNAVLEAKAAGKVLILSDIPAHREVVGDYPQALFFPLDDTRALSVRIKAALELPDEHLAPVMRSWDECAADYQKLYVKITGR